MAADSSRSSSSADSYVGSLISLTSKSEMRYEGVLYNINTEESSIGLRNVRSFGTEGRKKDGPQVPPSDKVYEYILFRGSDIKDLQVKSSPPVQTSPPLNSDPAIIQSHYSRPASTSSSLSSTVSGSLTDLSSHTPQLGLSGSSFPGALPLYQPGGNLGSWGPSPPPPPPPSANGSGLAMPMYWQGYYGPPNRLPQLHQQSLLRPPPGLSMPPSMQQPMQYPGFNASLPTGAVNLSGPNLPEYPPPLLPSTTGSLNLASMSLPASTFPSMPSMLPPAPSIALAPETPPGLIPNKVSNPALPMSTLSANLPTISPLNTATPDTNAVVPPITSKTSAISGPTFSYQTMSQPIPSSVGSSSSSQTETSTPSLVTPDQLLQSGPAALSSSQSSQTAHKDVEVVQVSSSSAEMSVPIVAEAQPPILPLPQPPQPSRAGQQLNGAPFQSHQGYRGRERGRGTGKGWVAAANPTSVSSKDLEERVDLEDGELRAVWITLRGGTRGFGWEGADGHTCRRGAVFVTDITYGVRYLEYQFSVPHLWVCCNSRAISSSRPATKFTEDFDFTAMNEKFNKDEVWGHLGKSNNSHLNDKEGYGEGSFEDDYQDEDETESAKSEIKVRLTSDVYFLKLDTTYPNYNKDDFFDSLSCNALDHESNRGRTRFSEQMKIDTETFGDFSRYRGGRGGRWPGRGGRFRGSYYGRGYGYVGRGRGRGMSNYAS
ncbi:decapping 5 [Actinidia rufa]|uniref:Decapping 5 n=1 Tax=Actinidia rufa TaxID=165716 RepID=A0A7J0HDW2_9ERIC|nr:decapping 5 [Actinidia rufa]